MLIDFKTALFACLLIVIGSHASASNIIRAFEDAGVREDGSGAFRTHCLESHVRNDDPLLAPKRAGASHRHVFFGNPTVDSTTNFKSLKKALATKCDGNVLNRSGYWVPALYGNSGQRIKFVDPSSTTRQATTCLQHPSYRPLLVWPSLQGTCMRKNHRIPIL